MERGEFNRRLRKFLNNQYELTWIVLNINDYILENANFDQELIA